MALSLIDATTGANVSSADYNANNAAIEGALNSLDGGTLQAGSVENTALVNSEFTIPLNFPVVDASSAGAIVYLPVTGLTNYRPTSGRYFIDDSGDTTDIQFVVEAGRIDSGSWTLEETTVSTVTITNDSNNPAEGVFNLSLSSDLPNTSATILRVRITQHHANAGNLYVSLELKRELTT